MFDLVCTSPESPSSCDARDLHAALGVGRRFTTWIQGRIDEYGFEEGEDYTMFGLPDLGDQTSGRGGDRRSVTYHVSLDMAKELAMLENSQIGRDVRRYFIQAEKQLVAAQRLEHQAREVELVSRVSFFKDRAPHYSGGDPRFTVMARFEESYRETIGVGHKSLAYGYVGDLPLKVLDVRGHVFFHAQLVAVILGLSYPQVKALAKPHETRQHEGYRYVSSTCMPEPVLTH